MTSEQRSERPGRGDPLAAPTVELRTPEELAERRSRKGSGRRRERRPREPRAPGRAVPIAAFAGGIAAIAFVVLSLADGGFEPGVWAQATIVVWWIALVALLAGAWPRGGIPGSTVATGLALFGLTALAAASMAWTNDLGAAYADAVRAAGYLGVFAVAAIATRAGAARQLLAGLAVGILVLAVLALVSRLHPGFTGGADEALALEVSGGRLSHPLGYWNALGACMASGLALFVWLGAAAPTRIQRAFAVAAIPVVVLTLFFTGSRGGVLAAGTAILALLIVGPRRVTLASVAALGLGVAAPLVLVAASSTALVEGSASAAAASAGDQLTLLAMVAIALTVLLAWLFDHRIAGVHLPVLGARRVATAFVIVGVLGFLAADPVTRLKAIDAPPEAIPLSAEEQTTRFANVGGSGRVQFWDAAVDAIAEEPLRGIGAGGFEAWWNLNGDLSVPVEHAHSLFLESGAELGIGGLLLAFVFFLVPGVAGVRRRLSPTAWADTGAARGGLGAAMALLAAGLATAAVEWTWDVPAAFVPVVIAAALLATPPPTAAAREAAAARPRRLGRSALVGACVALVAGAAIAGATALFLAQDSLAESRSALAAGQARKAANAARDASNFTPFDAEPYLAEALASADLDRPADARQAMQEAEERAELDWQLWWTEAGLELRAGELGRAIHALNQAEALTPRGPKGLFRRPTALDAGLFRELYERCCASQPLPNPTDQTPGTS